MVLSISISVSSTTHIVRGDPTAHCVDSDAVDLKHVYLNLGVLKIEDIVIAISVCGHVSVGSCAYCLQSLHSL